MWEYISNIGKAIRKYRTEIAIAACSLAIPFFAGCDSMPGDNRRISEIMSEGRRIPTTRETLENTERVSESFRKLDPNYNRKRVDIYIHTPRR